MRYTQFNKTQLQLVTLGRIQFMQKLENTAELECVKVKPQATGLCLTLQMEQYLARQDLLAQRLLLWVTVGIVAPLLLALCRLGQGLGLGGEWSGAVLLATENAPEGNRAWYGMFPQLGAPIGFILATGSFLGQGFVEVQHRARHERPGSRHDHADVGP